jgi:hypothetical protein
MTRESESAAHFDWIDALGYDPRIFEVDDGVFKTRIIDRQSGAGEGSVRYRCGELLRAATGSEQTPAPERATP